MSPYFKTSFTNLSTYTYKNKELTTGLPYVNPPVLGKAITLIFYNSPHTWAQSRIINEYLLNRFVPTKEIIEKHII